MKAKRFVLVEGADSDTAAAIPKRIGCVRILTDTGFPERFDAAYILRIVKDGSGLHAMHGRTVSGFIKGRICISEAQRDEQSRAAALIRSADAVRVQADVHRTADGWDFTLTGFDTDSLEAEIMRITRALADIERESDKFRIEIEAAAPPVFNDLGLFDALRDLAPKPHPPRFTAHGYSNTGRVCYTEFTSACMDLPTLIGRLAACLQRV